LGNRIVISDEVRDALSEGSGVVALETAVLTHGLPRASRPAPPTWMTSDHSDVVAARERLFGTATPLNWNNDAPLHLATLAAMEDVVRSAGAIPATCAVLDGVLRIGLTSDEQLALANAESPEKCSTRDLARTISAGKSGGTTVAGTLAAIGAANRMLQGQRTRPIRVFATGGIGGVHRGFADHPDQSADLRALAMSPVAVISAGAKAILDLSATREALDSLMVPVIGFNSTRFGHFTAPGLDCEPPIPSVESAAALQKICYTHWMVLRRREGILVSNELPIALGLAPEELEAEVARAVKQAEERGIRGPDLTPFLLDTLAEQTKGRTLDANIALLLSNACLGAALAKAFVSGQES
jgi:pseudouridine-5'-phosphate glycosidase